jgi:fructose-bisphosphate aldolase class 1
LLSDKPDAPRTQHRASAGSGDTRQKQRRENHTANRDLDSVAQKLVADGKGILAADETVPTLTRRFDKLGIRSTEERRRTYREMLFTSPGVAEFISGVFEQGVTLEAMLPKPNMVLAGKNCSRQASVPEVATATLRCLRRHVPAAVPGIVFLSGGQSVRLATVHLNAINQPPGPKPWKISFSYGRALQDPALEAWHGREDNLAAGQRALYHRARSNGAACVGKYMDEMEAASQGADDPPDRQELRDD